MMMTTQEFERTRPLGGQIVADFVLRGTRPRQGSFTVYKDMIPIVKGLEPGSAYKIGLEVDEDGPCSMKLVSVEIAN